MRVSLQIDGDSSGAQKAAQDAAAAIGDLGKVADAANGSVAHLANASASAGAANDNAASSIGTFAAKLSELSGKVQGIGGSFAKAASGAAGFANDIGAITRSAGGFSIVTAGAGLAVSAATAFYGVISRGSEEASKRLDDQARLVGTVRDAYKDAGKAAGQFLDETKNVTLFLLEQKQAGLKDDLAKAARGVVSGINFDSTLAAISNQNNLGVGGANGSFNDAEVKYFQTLQGAVAAFNESVTAGQPDLDRLKNSLVDIGRGDTSAAGLATSTLERIKKETDAIAKQAKDGQAAINKIRGVASDTDNARLGIGTAASTAEFDRFTKSIERQSKAMEADAQSAGLGAGAVARLRAEFVLTEAAQQAGITVAGTYADKIAAIAARAGEAAQKLSLARLESDTAFNRDQLGRTAADASVADQLRGAFGNNVDLNGAAASAIRLNETMRELKGTTQEVATGAFRDFRTELQNGTNVWEAFGKAGVNALNRIIDKLADKAFDKLITGTIGNFLGIGGTGTVANGGIVLGGPGGPGMFAAAGGGDFGPGWGVVGEKGAELIKVHAGGVTVYPHHLSKPYLPGFADGGSLSPWGDVGAPPAWIRNNNTSGQQSGGGQQNVNVQVEVSVNDKGELQAHVRNVSAQTVGEFAQSPNFIQHVADAANSAKTYRML
jgi:hypothetical protein